MTAVCAVAAGDGGDTGMTSPDTDGGAAACSPLGDALQRLSVLLPADRTLFIQPHVYANDAAATATATAAAAAAAAAGGEGEPSLALVPASAVWAYAARVAARLRRLGITPGASSSPGGADESKSKSQLHLVGRGLLSSTFRLNFSALYWIGDARRDCVAGVEGVLGGVRGC